MNKINVIGIGFRPLDKKAREALLGSDVVLTNDRLKNVFKGYEDYETVKDKIEILGSAGETIEFIRNNYEQKSIALLAAGDPMFFGIGKTVVEKFGKEDVEIFPDLSSVEVAFSRTKVSASDSLFISLHGGPDPDKRRKLKFEIDELPMLLDRHDRLAILTDRVNSPSKIAESLSATLPTCRIYVCEKLGYDDERINEGTPAEIAGGEYEHPNVVIVVK